MSRQHYKMNMHIAISIIIYIYIIPSCGTSNKLTLQCMKDVNDDSRQPILINSYSYPYPYLYIYV